MPKKNKHYFPKIIIDARLKIALVFLLVLFSVFAPLRPAKAIFGIGDVSLFELSTNQLDALDFVDSVILRLVIFIFLLIVGSEAFIVVAANLLQWAINIPLSLGVMDPAKNLLVSLGWNFTLGLVNLFFILAFVIIALAYILRSETFGMKKALPRLIIIALLVNFSLVFMGVFVDIADIFMDAILDAMGGDIVILAIKPLISSTKSVAAWFVAIPTTYLLSALAPYINVAALLGIASLILADIAGLTGGILLKGIFLIILNFVIGTIFFFYFALFLMRIVIIWVLAILAPLALFASIFPQTKRYWDEWLKLFLQWLNLGIIVLFLTGLGLKFFAITGDSALLPWGSDIATGRGTLPSFIYNYLFLLVYLGIVYFYSMTKFAPELAGVLMGYGKSFGRGVRKIATTKSMQRDVWGPASESVAGRLGKLGEGLKGRAEKKLETSGTGGRLFWGAVRGAGKGIQRPVSPLIEYAAKQRKVGLPAGWAQMSIPEKVGYVGALSKDSDRLVLASAMTGEKTYQHAPDNFRKNIRKIRDKFAKDPRYAKEINDLMNTEPDKIEKEILIEFKLAGISPTEIDAATNRLKRDLEREKIEAKIQAIVGEYGLTGPNANNVATGVLHARGLSPRDISEVTKGSLKSLPFQLATRRMSSSHLQTLRNSFDEETVGTVLDEGSGLNRIDTMEELKKIYDVNPRLVRWAFNNPAGREMLNWSDKFDKFFEKYPHPSPPTPPPTPTQKPTPPPTPPPSPSLGGRRGLGRRGRLGGRGLLGGRRAQRRKRPLGGRRAP